MIGLTIAKVAELVKGLEELDDCIRAEQLIYGKLKNDAIEQEEGTMESHYAGRLDEFMAARAGIDAVIEFLDGREVKL